MSTNSEQRPPIVRFFETFFQEQNIKWMLGVGMLILIGSSLMLVTSHWDDYTPVWKSVILLAYTMGVHGAGQVSFHSLGLRKTGTVLMALTVLLIPLGFHALSWNYHNGFGQHATSLLLFAGNVIFAALASRRIFTHFLRSSQPTFLASYAILCVAATLVPLASASVAPWLALGLWSVFAVGAIKVNRHVFWLAEERRLPRICGFFPILLLGGQFMTLFATGLVDSSSLVGAIAVEWLGFGLVLTAIPVLLTVDALARVFLEINGQLTRPFPWSLVIPMLVGLLLTMTGVCVSAIGFPHAYALVPTSALAAVMMAVVARRTGNSAFVWAMLAGVLMAYQCSPVFFRELAAQLVQHGAAAVHESRLPIAFYGLTYFPLLAALSVSAKWRLRHDDALFAIPIKRFAVSLGAVLLLASLSHVKAIFPVSLATVALFSLQAMLFRDRRIAGLGIVAWIVATLSGMSFATDVLLIPASTELAWLIPSIGIGCLLFPGMLIDRRIAKWTGHAPTSRWIHLAPDAMCEVAGRWATMALAVGWAASSIASLPAGASVSGGLIAVLLIAHAVRYPTRRVAELSLVFIAVYTAILSLTLTLTLSIAVTTSIVSLLLFAYWSVLPRLRNHHVAAFRDAGPRVAVAGFLTLVFGVLLPGWLIAIAAGHTFTMWIAATLTMIWVFDAARTFHSPQLTILGWVTVLANTSTVAVEVIEYDIARQWLPAIWGAVSLFTMIVIRIRTDELSPDSTVTIRQSGGQVVRLTLHRCILVTLGLIAAGSLLFFTMPIRIAGGIALVGLLMTAVQRRQPTMRTISLLLVNWQVLCAVIQFFVPTATDIFSLTLEMLTPAAVPLAFLGSTLLVSWQYRLAALAPATPTSKSLRQIADTSELIGLQRALLMLLTGSALAAVAFTSTFDGLSWLSAIVVGTTFLVLAADSLITAFRLASSNGDVMGNNENVEPFSHQQAFRSAAQTRVWTAQVILAAGVLHLALCGVITVGNGFSMFAVLGTGLLAWTLSQWAARSPKTEFMAGPLAITGQCLPAITVVIGMGRHVLAGDSRWLGMNSLALLLAAGFYFWRGLERRSTKLLTGSAVIVNVALTLLWNELRWSDPQFFMIPLGVSLLGLVELLRREIPEKALNPLRYAAALVILVSPTFHIVGGSWLHLFSLMVVSVGVILAAMGLRIRALMYTGVGFLIADIIAMLVRGSIDNPGILWIAGIAFGTLVIGLAAYCERHREKLLQRMRLVASQLEVWE